MTYQLECIAKADVRSLYDSYGAMVSPAEWPDEIALAVRSVTPAAAGGFNVQFHDKRNAVDTLSKLKGLYESDDKITNPLEDAFSKIPRDDLVKMKEFLDTLTKIESE